MALINSITPEQEALLPTQAQKWIDIALSTEPADRTRAEEGVRAAYEAVGLAPPKYVIWLDSPLSGAYGVACASAAISTGPHVVAQVRAQVQAQVWDQVSAQVSGQVSAQVWDQVWNQVWNEAVVQVSRHVWGQVWNEVSGQVSAQVWDQVWDQVSAQVSGQVSAQVPGQVWDQDQWRRGLIDMWSSYWCAWFDTAVALGVTGLEPFAGIKSVAQTAGWWWCYRDFAILTERPVAIHRDNKLRLHNSYGPAVVYRDGFAVYAWHGTRVPADMIAGEWTIERALREPNTEFRRCAVEIIAESSGWRQVIHDAGWTQVGDAAPDPGNPGQHLTLWHVPADQAPTGGIGLYAEPVRLLHCTNATRERDGSRHEFGLTVPADIPDALAAAAWSFGVDRDTYAGLIRAC